MATVSSTHTASELQTQFLTLLATQLSNQNPLDPMESTDMTTVLSSLTQLEQMEIMNLNFSDLLQQTNLGEATNMIGLNVTFFPTDSDGNVSEESHSGIVMEVNIVDSQPKLRVDGYDVALEEVISVTYPTYE